MLSSSLPVNSIADKEGVGTKGNGRDQNRTNSVSRRSTHASPRTPAPARKARKGTNAHKRAVSGACVGAPSAWIAKRYPAMAVSKASVAEQSVRRSLINVSVGDTSGLAWAIALGVRL